MVCLGVALRCGGKEMGDFLEGVPDGLVAPASAKARGQGKYLAQLGEGSMAGASLMEGEERGDVVRFEGLDRVGLRRLHSIRILF